MKYFKPILFSFLALAITLTFTTTNVFAQDTEEPSSQVMIKGQLIELSSTDLPTTIIVRERPEGEWIDHTVDLTESTWIIGAPMEDWITGDYVKLFGTRNDNTFVVEASSIENQSVNEESKGLNGWITEIDLDGNLMSVQWDGEDHLITVLPETRMVVPPINPATLSDFEIGDRVRLRLKRNDDAIIIVALRRGDEIFLKARTRGFYGELSEIDLDAMFMTVQLGFNKHLGEKDVNNLVGLEGELLTITWDEHTRFVRRYFGRTSPDLFMPGDDLFIVGRVGDDGVVHARLIKDRSIEKADPSRFSGKIIKVDTELNEIQAKLNTKNQKWIIAYDDDTEILKNGTEATEDDLMRGDSIHVQGTANAFTNIIDADTITVNALLHKPLWRVRPLKDIVGHRIRTSVGKAKGKQVVEDQDPPGTSDELTQEEIDELENELEEELEGFEDDDDSSGEDDEDSDDGESDETDEEVETTI